ncbi:MAG: bifunctional riboflavin kinase/FAD synthetase [Candidatus Saganbacteria bacterium]|nr:bifunctional riboflavin kinase/FAD synthetase [Candidatus Saganbacteria bacterium]
MTVIALGTFDGVHLGHQKIIKSAVAYAKINGLTPTAITFDPHPQQLISPERGLKLLTTLDERHALLHQYGIKRIFVIKFDRRTQKLGPNEFIKRIIVNRLSAKHVFVGYDFAFGWGRIGGVKDLRGHGFSVTMIPAVLRNSHPVKSRRIREELSWGNFNNALADLGHAYQISGKVIKGSGRGRKLGFPTVNLKLDKDKLIPSHGIYAAWTEIKGKRYKVAVNIGARPSFGIGEVLVEGHIIGFSGNLYRKHIVLNLVKKLREEKHFSDIAKLVAQIKKDVKSVQLLFK